MIGHESLGRLYLVATPRAHLAEGEFLERIKAALEGGVDVLQLRCKDMEAMPYLRLAERVAALAHDARVPFIINDRVDVALAVGADGVHLGQQDLAVEYAQRILPGRMIGRSSHEPAHVERAITEAASYFAVGPVWETPTKPGRRPAGLAYVREVAEREISIPWYAIGGISLDNVSEVLDAGATRIAIVRAVLDARDPAQAASEFAAVLTKVPLAEMQEVTCT